MRRLAALVTACYFLLPALAVADPPPYGIVRPDSERGLSQLQLGKELFAGNCSMCHGSLGEGVQNPRPTRSSGDIVGMGPSLKTVGEGTVDFYLRTGYMPLHGAGTEPVRSRVLFSDREIAALVGYVGTLSSKPNEPPVYPDRPLHGDLAHGQRLFTEHCAGCHQVVAQGGYVTGARVPPLEAASPVQVKEAVRTGPYLMPRFSSKAISDRELEDIATYVQWTKNADHRGGWPLGYVGPLPEGLVTWFIAVVVLVATCVVIGKRLKSS